MFGDPDRSRRRYARLAFLMGLLLAGCTAAKDASGPVVLEIQGNRLSRDDVRWAYDAGKQPGEFEAATSAQRSEFLNTIGEKEVLLALAREQKYDLTPMEKVQLRDAQDALLLKALEKRIIGPLLGDSTARYYLKRISRQNHLLMFLHPSDSVAAVARREVEAGAPFADVVLKYVADDSLRARKGDIGWKTAGLLGREFATELHIDEREPGYLSQVRRTPSGAVFYRYLGSRDFDYSTDKMLAQHLPELAQTIHNYNGVHAHLDSLRQAAGLEIHEEALPALMAGMNAYWDSLAATVKTTGVRPESFVPPIWRFDSASRAIPLYRAHGKQVTIGEFVRGLGGVVPRLWPMGPKMDIVRGQIDYRVGLMLQLEEIQGLGIDRQPDMIRATKAEEEKLLLGGFYQRILSKDVTVAPEEIRSYYDQNMDKYKTKEAIRLSYAVFQKKAEADAFYREAEGKSLDWWSDRLQGLAKKRPDVRVVFNSLEYDLTKAIPDTVQGAVKSAWDVRVGEIAKPAPELNGRWLVARVIYRMREGITPFEKVDKSIEGVLRDQKIEERVGAMVKDGKTRYGLKLHPERLEAKG